MDKKFWVRVRNYARRYYNRELPNHIGEHTSHLASEALEAAGKHFKVGYGVEGFCDECGREGVSYINMGDTYSTTVLFDTRTEQFSIGCWGDIAERVGKTHFYIYRH